MAAPALRLALDQNFPSDVIRQTTECLPEGLELKSLQQIDPWLYQLEDRPLIIALQQRDGTGLITNNYKML